MKENLSSSDLHVGPVRHATLPGGIIDRIKAFKEILGNADPISLEKTIDAFTRDADPERELVIWERIANTFQLFIEHNQVANHPGCRKEILSVLLGASMGQEHGSNPQHLTKAQIKHLILTYQRL
jgi:hypothetical protein